MQKISGFFANHGFWSIDNIPLVIAEVEKTFTVDCPHKILIRENMGFDPVRAQKVFKRSAHEKDLVKLLLESEHQTKKQLETFRRLCNPEVKKLYLNRKRSYFLFMLDELSKLRERVSFQLLFESGTTTQMNTVSKKVREIIQEEQDALRLGKKEEAERLSILGEIELYKQSCLRNKLLQLAINKLLEKYSSVCLQIIFGKHHQFLMDPYIDQKDIDTSIIVHDEPGDFVSDTIFIKIRNKENFSKQDRQMSVVADCVIWLVETLRKMPEVIDRDIFLHYGKMIEATLTDFSEKHYNQLVCSKGLPVIKTLFFLDQSGAFDRLAEEYPETVNFCRYLAKGAASF